MLQYLRGGSSISNNNHHLHNKLLLLHKNIKRYKENTIMYRLATVDQLKFLFLFVLNSSAAALATQANRYSSVAAAASTDTSNNRYSRPTGNESSLSNGYINFR